MDFKINNKTYVIYVPEDKKGYLYLVNKSTGKVDFRLLYSQAEALFGTNLKDIKDNEIGLEKNTRALEPVNVQNRAERVVAIWSNFKRKIMTPGGLTDVERKNDIKENPNAGPVMNRLYDTIVSISGNVQSITAYSKKWFGETGDKKDSDANYKLTEDILESMRLFTSFYTIGKRHNGARDNPFKYDVNNRLKFAEDIDKLTDVIKKIKTASGAKFKTGLDIMDGLQYYIRSKSKSGLIIRYVVEDEGRSVEKASPQREPPAAATAPAKPTAPTAAPAATDGSQKGMAEDNPFIFDNKEDAAKLLRQMVPIINADKNLNKELIYYAKYNYKPYNGAIYKFVFPAGRRKGSIPKGTIVRESFKEKREKLLSEAIFKKLVR